MGRSKAPGFDVFWKAYPVHKDRASAERAWNRLTASDRTRAVAGIAAYRDECLRTGVAVCYGQGYLNRRRWEDEPDAPAGLRMTAAFCDEAAAVPGDLFGGMDTW